LLSNVRELRQTILRAAYLGDGPELLVRNLSHYDESSDEEVEPFASRPDAATSGPLRPLLDELKRDYCVKVLAESTSMSAAAETAGFTPRGFQLMLKKLGLRAEDYLRASEKP
jgi:DNA-binding NtrC family response regulator